MGRKQPTIFIDTTDPPLLLSARPPIRTNTLEHRYKYMYILLENLLLGERDPCVNPAEILLFMFNPSSFSVVRGTFGTGLLDTRSLRAGTVCTGPFILQHSKEILELTNSNSRKSYFRDAPHTILGLIWGDLSLLQLRSLHDMKSRPSLPSCGIPGDWGEAKWLGDLRGGVGRTRRLLRGADRIMQVLEEVQNFQNDAKLQGCKALSSALGNLARTDKQAFWLPLTMCCLIGNGQAYNASACVQLKPYP